MFECKSVQSSFQNSQQRFFSKPHFEIPLIGGQTHQKPKRGKHFSYFKAHFYRSLLNFNRSLINFYRSLINFYRSLTLLLFFQAAYNHTSHTFWRTSSLQITNNLLSSEVTSHFYRSLINFYRSLINFYRSFKSLFKITLRLYFNIAFDFNFYRSFKTLTLLLFFQAANNQPIILHILSGGPHL